MSDLQFTPQDCDDILKHCLAAPNIRTKDLEIIPRQNNYIFIITTEQERVCLYAKTNSKPPLIDKIFYEDFKSVLKPFKPTITPKFVCGKSELLFFEDLTCQRFQTSPGLFDLKFIKKVFNVLAEVHAAGFAYEEVKGEKLDQQYGLEYCSFDLKEAEDLLWSSIENKERLEEVRLELKTRQLFNCAKTLCHGNLTRSNILFHYANGAPDQCRLVNFKPLYASPAHDVLQVVFLNTDEDFRKHHLDDVLKFYYNCLEEELKKYDFDVNKVLTCEDFKLSCDNVLPLIKLQNALLKPDETKIFMGIFDFPRITKEDCYAILKNVMKSCDYDLLSFQTTYIEDDFSKLLTIKIKSSSEDKTIRCVVKTQNTQDSFSREVFIVCTFLPKLQELGISLMNDILPVCCFQKPKDIVLEDLSQDYQTLSDCNFTALSLIVRKLAKFHAGSIVFEEKMSEKLKRNYRLTNDYKLLNTSFFNKTTAAAELFPELNSDGFKQFVTPSNSFCNVVSHGLPSSKNILIKFNGETPIDCRFINFENLRYCPPAIDFLSVMYLSTEEASRETEDKLKKIYHDELGRILASYNCSVQNLCPFQEFEDSLLRYKMAVRVETFLHKIQEVASEEINWKAVLKRKCVDPTFKAQLRKNVLELYNVLPKDETQ